MQNWAALIRVSDVKQGSHSLLASLNWNAVLSIGLIFQEQVDKSESAGEQQK